MYLVVNYVTQFSKYCLRSLHIGCIFVCVLSNIALLITPIILIGIIDVNPITHLFLL